MSSLRQQLSKILNVLDTASWQILDTNTDTGLYLIHYTSDASMVRYGSLQGTVVDLPNELIVVRSYGYTPIISADELKPAEYDEKIHLLDGFNPNIDWVVDPKITTFYPGFDGVVMRVFFHSGHVYHSTHRKLDAIKSTWGNSPTFIEIYNQLGGPTDEVLFDLDKDYSPYVHIFILAHPSLQIVSKNPIGSGYLIYLESQKMWEPENVSYPQDRIDTQLHEFEVNDQFKSNPKQPNIFQPPQMSLDEVNTYLKYGYYSPQELTITPSEQQLDLRLYPGEFVFAFLQDGGVLKIESTPYRWRWTMRDNNPNQYYQFYIIANGKFIRAEFPEEKEVYNKKFPILTPYDLKSIQDFINEDGSILFWPQEPMQSDKIERILSDPQERFYNIFLCYLYSMPPSLQQNVIPIYDYYLEDIQLVTNWLIQINEKDDLNSQVIPSRAKNIISTGRDFGRTRLEGGTIENLDILIRDEIIRLVKEEEGSSLFRLVTASQEQL